MSSLINSAFCPRLKMSVLHINGQIIRYRTSRSLVSSVFARSGITNISLRNFDLSRGMQTFECNRHYVRSTDTHSGVSVNFDNKRARQLSCSFSLQRERFYCKSSSPSGSSSSVSTPQERPSVERLHKVEELMNLQIPTILSQRHEYRIYTADVIFENNWDIDNPRQTVGIGSYVLAIVKTRFYMHSNYAKIKVAVLSSEIDETSSTVLVKWRLSYLPQAKAFMFWKYRPFKFKAIANQLSDSMDGVSTFHVNAKGFIYKHELNRVTVKSVTEHSPS